MNGIKYSMTGESITVIHKGKTYNVQKGSPNYTPLRKALMAEDEEEVQKHLTSGKSLEQWAKGEFKVVGEEITFRGELINHNIAHRIREMAAQGIDPSPLFKFWERLQKNPSMRSVMQLWDFLQHSNIPLTPEGKFLAYKGVRDDYKDSHSGKINNSPGSINRMPRNKISDDPKVECHFGFHVGALGYAKGFSQRVVVCEVDPEHVVCVPYDHSHQKMRVCEYKVIGNYGAPLPSTVVIPDTEVEDFVETDEDDFEKEKDAESTKEEGATPEKKKRTSAKQKEAKAEKKAERDKAKAERVTRPVQVAEKKGFAEYNKMDVDGLMKLSIDELRQYAGKGLNIVGASKIPGGKTELVKKILKVRK